MPFPSTSPIRKAFGALAILPCTVLAWQPGVYPVAPARMQSTGFAVDTRIRNDVVSFWQAVYQASEGYEQRIAWTGNYKGTNGKTSDAFVDDVERRINYFRAMCGVPANVQANTGSTVLIESTDSQKPPSTTRKADAAQAAALMLIRNYDPVTGNDPAMTHDPAKSLVGWSEAAWNASSKGNLAFGSYGPGAITEYMIEEISSSSTTSVWNTLVGHRRWIAFPAATNFATGDQPGASVTQPPTNVLYISQNPGELVPDPTPGFVAYPAPGFFPAPVNSRYWSLSRAGADFNSAKVKMTDSNGKSVAVSNISPNSSYGGPALVWEVDAAAATKSVYSDITYNVSVTSIGGTGIPTSFNYAVTLINPDRITSNQTLSGSGSPVSNKTTIYTFSPPPKAEQLGVTAFLKKSTQWIEGAETSPKALMIDRTGENYPLKVKMSDFVGFGSISGSKAFRLTFPVSYDPLVRGVPAQSFELARLILANQDAKLQFQYRRGFMTTGSTLVVETTGDGGVTWEMAGKPITGVSNTRYDTKTSSATINLPKSAQPIRIRFRYYTKPGAAIYTHEAAPTSPTGIFIDDITTRNCDWLDAKKTTYLTSTATQYSFNASSAGGSLVDGSRWCLGMRTRLGGKWFPVGPVKAVTITAP